MHPSPLVAAVLAALCLGVTASGQVLLKDFDTTPPVDAGNSSPHSFKPLPGNRLLFSMSTRDSGFEPWVTDGTLAGTTQFVEIQPGYFGSNLRDLVELSPGVYLGVASTTGTGGELWRTDGTAAGTFLVKDMRPGPETSIQSRLVRSGNLVFFFANDGVHGTELWCSDGTTAGTRLVIDLAPGAAGMSNGTASLAAIGSGGEVVFTALLDLQWQMLRTDGTAAGTASIHTFDAYFIFGPKYLTEYGNRVLFQARDTSLGNDQVWITDGTAAGTIPLGTNGAVPYFQIAGGLAYFRGWSAASGYELWVTDGTVVGTRQVIDLLPGGGIGGNGDPWLIGELQGDVLFFSYSPSGRALWRSDGTVAGTTQVANVRMDGSFHGADWGRPILGELWFRATDGTTAGLYRTDGTTAGTSLVTTIEAVEFGVIGSTVFFRGDDGSSIGQELYTTDGTPGGTQLFLDATPSMVSQSSNPLVLGTFRDEAVVRVDDGVHGEEPWLTDGTPGGTRLLDLTPGPQGGYLHGFAANDARMMLLRSGTGADYEPWFSDGTAAGTYQLDLFPASANFFAARPIAFGGRFLFSGGMAGVGEEPWISDGTAAGTYQLADLAPGAAPSGPQKWWRFGDRVLFVASQGLGLGVFSTDGTTAGTVPLGVTISGGTFLPVEFGGLAYFAAPTASQGVELWRTDGTPGGTTLALDLAPGLESSNPFSMAVAGNRLVLVATIGGVRRLVATDGSLAGTSTLSLLASEFHGPFPLRDGLVAFVTRDAVTDTEQLWRTDGTDAGTVLLSPFNLGTPYFATAKCGIDRLLLQMDDGNTGQELWSTDGTAAGTFAVFDMAPTDSSPSDMVRVGNQVVFAADDGVHGRELFAVPLAQTDDWAAEVYGGGCPGTGGATPTIALDGVARVSAGAPFGISLHAALPNSFGLLGLSTRRGAVPIPGCTLWLGGVLDALVVFTDGFGATSLPIVPPLSSVGMRFDAQFLVLDPNGAAFGFASTTPALEFVIGL